MAKTNKIPTRFSDGYWKGTEIKVNETLSQNNFLTVRSGWFKININLGLAFWDLEDNHKRKMTLFVSI